jgi:methylthioribose-1-phosphate isomerase
MAHGSAEVPAQDLAFDVNPHELITGINTGMGVLRVPF